MVKPTKYELLYNATKSILKWHIEHEKNNHAQFAYSSVLDWIENLEKVHDDLSKLNEMEKGTALLADIKNIIDKTEGARMGIIRITKGEPVQ
jgi:uncharacterized membrane protein